MTEIQQVRELWRPRSCPRCAGALFRERPGEWTCLSCGYEELDPSLVAEQHAREAAFRASNRPWGTARIRLGS